MAAGRGGYLVGCCPESQNAALIWWPCPADKLNRRGWPDELVEQVEQRWGVVVAADHNDRRSDGQFLQGVDGAGHLRVRGPDRVEQIARVND